MRDLPLWVVEGQAATAGFTGCVTLLVAFWYLRGRALAVLLWLAALSSVLTFLVVTNLVVLTSHSARAIDVAMDTRAVLLLASGCLCLPTCAAVMDQRLPRWLIVTVGVLCAGRLALWFGTDLVFRHAVDADGSPSYGPLMAITGVPFVALFLVTVGMCVLRSPSSIDRAIFIVGIVLAGTLLGMSVDDSTPWLSEAMTGFWVVPTIVAVFVVVGRHTSRLGQAHEALTGRQHALVDLGQAALRTTDPASVVALGLAALRTHLPALACDLATEPGTALVVPPGAARTRVIGSEVRADGVLVGRLRAAVDQERDVDSQAFLDAVAQVVAAAYARRSTEDRVRSVALIDQLTGLPNRAGLALALDRALPAGDDGTLCLLLVDLDGFRRLNELYGQLAGDEILRTLAARLRAAFGDGAVSRSAADEFAILRRAGATDQTHVQAAAGVRQIVANSVPVDGAPVSVTCTVGLAVARRGDTAHTLMRDAGTALAEARTSAHGIGVFDPVLRQELVTRAALEQDLSDGLSAGQIVVHYQPIVDLGTGRLAGVEALARWRRDGRLVPPAEWIPVAEQNNDLIARVGAAVLELACHEGLTVPSGLPGSAYLAVNVSPRQFADDGVLRAVSALLDDGIDARRLVLEVTETAVIDDVHGMRRQLQRLRRSGVRVALDDFGTGHSSLSLLTDLPVDTLKIDRSFVSRIDQPAGIAVVRAVLSVADSLGLGVVAEGIETAAQRAVLVEHGCRYGQGFLLARPGALPRIGAQRTSVDAAAPTATG